MGSLRTRYNSVFAPKADDPALAKTEREVFLKHAAKVTKCVMALRPLPGTCQNSPLDISAGHIIDIHAKRPVGVSLNTLKTFFNTIGRYNPEAEKLDGFIDFSKFYMNTGNPCKTDKRAMQVTEEGRAGGFGPY